MRSDAASAEVDEQIRVELEAGGTAKGIARELAVTEWRVRRIKQLMQDEGRLCRASDRRQHRSENAIIALTRELSAQLESLGGTLPVGPPRRSTRVPGAATGILHLSDLHFNELIDTDDNRYDFEVASARIEKLVDRARGYFRLNGVEKVVVFMGGDIINSDRRLDEVLAQATNRSRAMIIASTILLNALVDLRQDFEVDVLAVTGNEGRAKKELCWSDVGVTDSYDASVYWAIKMALSQSDADIRMVSIAGNAQVFTVNGKTILGLHGHQLNAGDQKSVQAIIGRYSASMDTRIDFVLCGHIHAALLSDLVARSSSLAGSNSYSGDGLQFSSRASQNIHIVREEGIESIKVDLQDTKAYDGYDISSLLEEHRAQSTRGLAPQRHWL